MFSVEIPHNWDMSFGKIGRLPTVANEFTEVPQTIGCKIPLSIVF